MAVVPPASFPCKAANEQHFHHHVPVNADSEWWFGARVPTLAVSVHLAVRVQETVVHLAIRVECLARRFFHNFADKM